MAKATKKKPDTTGPVGWRNWRAANEGKDLAGELLAWLVEHRVLRQLNPTDPIEYGVAL